MAPYTPAEVDVFAVPHTRMKELVNSYVEMVNTITPTTNCYFVDKSLEQIFTFTCRWSQIVLFGFTNTSSSTTTSSRYVNRFFYGPFILRRHFKENLRMTFQTEIDKKFCDTCQI